MSLLIWKPNVIELLISCNLRFSLKCFANATNTCVEAGIARKPGQRSDVEYCIQRHREDCEKASAIPVFRLGRERQTIAEYSLGSRPAGYEGFWSQPFLTVPTAVTLGKIEDLFEQEYWLKSAPFGLAQTLPVGNLRKLLSSVMKDYCVNILGRNPQFCARVATSCLISSPCPTSFLCIDELYADPSFRCIDPRDYRQLSRYAHSRVLVNHAKQIVPKKTLEDLIRRAEETLRQDLLPKQKTPKCRKSCKYNWPLNGTTDFWKCHWTCD